MDAEYLLTKFDNELRLKVLTNIWHGKSLTVSTTFWGLMVNILPEYGLYPQVNLAQIQQTLKRRNLITEQQPGLLVLTKAGQISKANYASQHYLPPNQSINLKYDLLAFKNIFLLANQAISELAYHNRHFYPYQIEAKQQWQIKQWLKRYPRERLIKQWQEALHLWLATLPVKDADDFVATLFGHQIPGKLLTDLKQKPTWTLFDKQQWQLAMFADLLVYSVNEQTIIGQLAQLAKRSLLAQSAAKTLELWQAGVSIEAISRARQLKITTIREHLLQGVMLENWAPPAIKKLIPPLEQVKLAACFNKQSDFKHWSFEAYGSANQPALFTYFRLWQLCAFYEERADDRQ
ncbi:helix-turn-helix domain-containing protein [Periweissella beninensis]|uniref:helix-turn-helix domain-containing protein n=1 Tax=Periweissella beninensis TaxID=504936 RepID=UPI0021A4F450|nr:helix-turn-helix domain-containing protein [Periweissella beninensis]MCT4395728.1 hypothetical protein [Periweissella beninensis]